MLTSTTSATSRQRSRARQPCSVRRLWATRLQTASLFLSAHLGSGEPLQAPFHAPVSTIVMRSAVCQTTSSAYVPRLPSSSLMLTVSCRLMRLIIMWNGRNGSQLLVLSEGGSNIVNLLKIFYFQPPLRIVFFRAKRLLCEKNAFLGRVGKCLSIRQL